MYVFNDFLRFFSYMFAHESQSHLWYNIVSQIPLAWFASVHHHGLIGHTEIVLTYLLSGMMGGLAFQFLEYVNQLDSDEVAPEVRLVGCSAGVFGLTGLCLADSVLDLLEFVWKQWQEWRSEDKSDKNSYYGMIDERSLFRLGYSERKKIMFVSRSITVALLMGFDVYSYTQGDSSMRITVSVHFAGFVSGLVSGLVIGLGRLIAKSVSQACGIALNYSVNKL